MRWRCEEFAAVAAIIRIDGMLECAVRRAGTRTVRRNLVVDKLQFTRRDEITRAVVEGPVTETVLESRAIRHPVCAGHDDQQR